MPNTPKKLYIGQPATTVGVLYTVPTGVKALVKDILLHNTTATDAVVTLHFVPSGGTVGTTNQILSYTVTAKDTVSIDLGGVLEAGETIQGIQTTASAVTVYVSGVEVS